MTSLAGSGHPTSALSAADIVSAIFFHAMSFDIKNPDNPDNDRFILSKGHAVPVLYAVYKELGILSDQDLTTYRKFDSVLEGHPTRRFRYIEAATGALGIGLSIGVGLALSAKQDKKTYKTYVLLGDGELAEGAIWEAAELAHHYKLNNLIAVVDCNRLGQSTESIHGHHTHRYEEKFKAFGWHVIVIDGHNMQLIVDALDKAAHYEGSHPVVIIAKTIKGYGVIQAEDQEGFHGKAFDKEELHEILQQLATRFDQAQKYEEKDYVWHPKVPAPSSQLRTPKFPISLPDPHYKKGDSIATRESYGQGLVAVGKVCPEVFVLDAEVKNSTYAEIFEEKFPDRFIQCFIAEQNMIGMALGFECTKKIPFASTFGAFMSRAHDQIRMTAISQAALRLVGSHAGVSIGEDGPSQMALEDIAMMRCLPESVVLYPCDAVSTYKLVGEMANYTKGISYLRTTRPKTSVLYDNYEEFPIGGSKVLRQSEDDVVCVVTAGITVFEALKAYELLQQEGISIAVVDAYSIKPLDEATLIDMGKKSGNTILTVEDHYLQGGLGEAVTAAVCNEHIYVHRLAVTQLPRSGKKEELLAWAGIDAQAIVAKIKSL
jgi:transketolase